MPARGAGGRKRRRPKEYVLRAPHYQKYYATNVNAFYTDLDIRIEVFNERRKHEGHVDIVADGVFILTPEAAALLKERLDAVLEKFQRAKGPIKVRPEARRELAPSDVD